MYQIIIVQIQTNLTHQIVIAQIQTAPMHHIATDPIQIVLMYQIIIDLMQAVQIAHIATDPTQIVRIVNHKIHEAVHKIHSVFLASLIGRCKGKPLHLSTSSLLWINT